MLSSVFQTILGLICVYHHHGRKCIKYLKKSQIFGMKKNQGSPSTSVTVTRVFKSEKIAQGKPLGYSNK